MTLNLAINNLCWAIEDGAAAYEKYVTEKQSVKEDITLSSEGKLQKLHALEDAFMKNVTSADSGVYFAARSIRDIIKEEAVYNPSDSALAATVILLQTPGLPVETVQDIAKKFGSNNTVMKTLAAVAHDDATKAILEDYTVQDNELGELLDLAASVDTVVNPEEHMAHMSRMLEVVRKIARIRRIDRDFDKGDIAEARATMIKARMIAMNPNMKI